MPERIERQTGAAGELSLREHLARVRPGAIRARKLAAATKARERAAELERQAAELSGATA